MMEGADTSAAPVIRPSTAFGGPPPPLRGGTFLTPLEPVG